MNFLPKISLRQLPRVCTKLPIHSTSPSNSLPVPAAGLHTGRAVFGTFEPDYLDTEGSTIPTYPPLNIQVQKARLRFIWHYPMFSSKDTTLTYWRSTRAGYTEWRKIWWLIAYLIRFVSLWILKKEKNYFFLSKKQLFPLVQCDWDQLNNCNHFPGHWCFIGLGYTSSKPWFDHLSRGWNPTKGHF